MWHILLFLLSSNKGQKSTWFNVFKENNLPNRIAVQSKMNENTFVFTFSRTRLFSSAASICGRPDKRNIFVSAIKIENYSLKTSFKIYEIFWLAHLRFCLHTWYLMEFITTRVIATKCTLVSLDYTLFCVNSWSEMSWALCENVK